MAVQPLFSDLVSNLGLWEIPNPNFPAILNTIGGSASTDAPTTARHVVNLSVCLPSLVAFVIEGDKRVIHVGHSPSFVPRNLLDPTPYDDCVALLVGNDLTTCVPVSRTHRCGRFEKWFARMRRFRFKGG